MGSSFKLSKVFIVLGEMQIYLWRLNLKHKQMSKSFKLDCRQISMLNTQTRTDWYANVRGSRGILQISVLGLGTNIRKTTVEEGYQNSRQY